MEASSTQGAYVLLSQFRWEIVSSHFPVRGNTGTEPPQPFRLPNLQHAHLRTAPEAHALDAADSARDIDLTVAPGLESGDVALVLYRREYRSGERNSYLAAVGVSAEHEVPRILRHQLLG